MFTRGKWPRHYAEEILALTNKDDRKKLLEQAPEHLQPLIKQHVTNQFSLRKNKRKVKKK